MTKPKIKRVYFVGAGFSAPLGFPVGASLPVETICRLRGLRAHSVVHGRGLYNSLRDTEKKRHLCDVVLLRIERFLCDFFGHKIDLRKATRQKIEDVFKQISVGEFYTVMHALSDMPGLFRNDRTEDAQQPNEIKNTEQQSGQSSNGELPFAASLYEVFSAVTRSFFIDISDTNPPKKDMKSLVESLIPNQQAIVSFNWDTELDYLLSIRSERKGETFEFVYTAQSTEPETLTILKPHGSIDWYDIKQGVFNNDRYFIADDDRRITLDECKLMAFFANELPVNIYEDQHSAFKCAPAITPPTFSKRFEYTEQHLIWHDVIQVCTDANEFVFLGYSLPPDDFLTRAALRSSFSEKSSKERQDVRCLVVSRGQLPEARRRLNKGTKNNGKSTKNLTDTTLASYRSVFGNKITQEMNWLNWEFGKTRGPLVEKINEMIQGAACL